MKKLSLKTIIIDDNNNSTTLLKRYINKTSHLELSETFIDINSALNFTDIVKPHVIFISVHLPGFSVFPNLFKITRYCKHVIITSSDSISATELYGHEVSDYLIRPFSYGRFKMCIQNILSQENSRFNDNMLIGEQNNTPIINIDEQKENITWDSDYIWIKCNKKTYCFWKPEIQFVEGLKDYVIINYKGKSYITHLTMHNIESLLGEKYFLRVHRSFIVQKRSVVSICGNFIETSFDRDFPIGTRYKTQIKLLCSN